MRHINEPQTLRREEQAEDTQAAAPCASDIVLASLLPVLASHSKADHHRFQIRAAAEYAHGDSAIPFPPPRQSARETTSGQETPAEISAI